MKGKKNIYTEEDINNIISNCESRVDLKRKYLSLYNYLLKTNRIDEVCSHMERVR